MIPRPLAPGRTDLTVSPIVFGAWSIGGAPFWADRDPDVSIAAIRAAVDAGVTTIDTAPLYGFGRSEEIVGRAIRGMRDRVTLATKCGWRWTGPAFKNMYKSLAPASIREEIEASLARLGTDRVDLYQVHIPDPSTPIPETMRTLEALRQEGKIGAIGVSNYTADQLDQALAVAPVVSMQPEYNMLSRDIEATLKPACVERNVGIIAYSPLASGALTGKYGRDTTFNDWRAGGKFGVFRPDVWPTVSQRIDRLKQLAADVGVTLTTLAIQWVLRQEGVTGAIVGANTAEQVVANVAALDIAIESEVWQSIDRILDR